MMKINLSTKLVGSHLCLGVVSVLFISIIFWMIASDALQLVSSQGSAAVEHADYERLQSACRSKEKQLTAFFIALERRLRMAAGMPWTVQAAKSFSEAFAAADNSTVSDGWQALTRTYDTLFRDLCASLEWEDAFLISSTGSIVYSLSKGNDLGLSLSREPLRGSPLGRAFANLQKNSNMESAFGDYAPYAPLRGRPAAFLITRIKDNGQVIGHLAIQVADEGIENIMEPVSVQEHSFESYLVGMDGHMRSDSVLDPQHYSLSASFRQGNKVLTESAQNALNGNTGFGKIKDYRGKNVLSSWLPVELLDTRWALICEIDEDEAAKAGSLMSEIRAKAVLKIMSCGSAALAATIIMMAVIAYYIARSINRPIMRAARVADAIASGDFSQRLNMHRSDEIGLMADALDHMAERVAINLWHKTGVAELAKQIRGKLDLQSLSHSIAACLSKHLGAQMAALYLLDKKGENLILTGSYAFHKRRGINSQIKIGEGIAGQAAFEREIISVTDLPEDYIRVSSSLGEAAPRNVLAVPFAHDGNLMGVMEFAAFSEFSDAEISFLKDVAESIAVIFSSAKSKQIQELLEETQQQAEELRRHGEELRESNEKLAEQTEKLQEMQADLEASNADLEKKSYALISQKQQVEQRNAELTKVREELEAKSKELTLASKYKSEFLANMSHELRTPMNSLLLLAQSLSMNKEGNLSCEQRQSAAVIVESGKELLNIIDEILDLATIEAGRIRKQVGEVALADLAENAQALFSHMAAAKGLDFNVTVEPELPASIVTDRTRLEQILKNFIGNAIKFTEQGEISLVFSRPPADVRFRSAALDMTQTVAVSVADTGIGIPEDKQQLIFEAFQQADGSTARKYGGTGLGLSISRQLAELLGGEIHLHSEPGKGSVFTLYLPFREEEQAGGQRIICCPSSPALKQPTLEERGEDTVILIIADNPATSLLLVNQCHEQGFQALTAASGEEGLLLAGSSQPAGIILDAQLPGLDGWETLAKLKGDLKSRFVPVCMICPEQRQADAIRHGAVAVLSQPVDASQLKTVFSRFAASLACQVKRLLVAEDDRELRSSLVALAGGEGILITEAECGAEVRELLRSQPFDCMVLDLGLPDGDGIELLRSLAEEQELRVPPVIVHTGRELSREEEKELNKYAEAVVIKNARSPERLMDEISLFLHRTAAQPDQPLPVPVPASLYDQETIFQGRRVLLVDDDMRNVFALSGILEDKGMEVLIAEDGNQALQLLAEEERIDLVLMDIMMPEMDGCEAMRRIREQPQFRTLPIIALTAKAMKEDRAKCIEAGASDYLAKPIDLERLLAMLRVWLSRR